MYAIIGGSGLQRLQCMEVLESQEIDTPYGAPSDLLLRGNLNDTEVIFLPRHGTGHKIPPHKINYKANAWAVMEAKATGVISVAAVGGITKGLKPGTIIIPDQIIDYTYDREHTFFDGINGKVEHIDFTHPYSSNLREQVFNSATSANISVKKNGVYGVTQGPRLETRAEINRMENDGVDVVGMTAMPEASLFRELNIPYVAINIVVNWAAGKGDSTNEVKINEIPNILNTSMVEIEKIIIQFLMESNKS